MGAQPTSTCYTILMSDRHPLIMPSHPTPPPTHLSLTSPSRHPASCRRSPCGPPNQASPPFPGILQAGDWGHDQLQLAEGELLYCHGQQHQHSLAGGSRAQPGQRWWQQQHVPTSPTRLWSTTATAIHQYHSHPGWSHPHFVRPNAQASWADRWAVLASRGQRAPGAGGAGAGHVDGAALVLLTSSADCSSWSCCQHHVLSHLVIYLQCQLAASTTSC